MTGLKKIFTSLSKKERGVFVAAATVGLVALITLIIIVIGQITKVIPAKGGTYTEGVVGQPALINPVLAETEIDKDLVRLAFSRLEDVASKIEPQNNGKTWRVRIKDDVKWSDGEKLTSDDIIFTVAMINDPENKSPLRSFWQGVATERVSELEMQFSLAAPYSFFSKNLAGLYIIPAHIFKNIPPQNWRISDYNLKPVGSGFYEFDAFDRKNDGFITDYALKEKGSAGATSTFINNIRFKFYENNDDLITAFNHGQVDGIGIQSTKDLENVHRSYEKNIFKTPSYYAVFFNQAKNPALKEWAVRKALTLATDKKKIKEQVFNGEAVLIDGPTVEKNSISENRGEAGSNYSLEGATQLLEEAGWKLPNGSNNQSSTSLFREKITGKENIKLELNLVVPKISFLTDTASLLQEMWQKAGFKVNLILATPQETMGKFIKNRDFEMIAFGNAPNDPQDLYPFWHSSERFAPGLNLSLYNNSRADSLMETIRQSLIPEERASKLMDLTNTIENDYPAVFLYSPYYLYLTNKNLGGVGDGLISEPADRFVGVNKWYLKTVRVLK